MKNQYFLPDSGLGAIFDQIEAESSFRRGELGVTRRKYSLESYKGRVVDFVNPLILFICKERDFQAFPSFSKFPQGFSSWFCAFSMGCGASPSTNPLRRLTAPGGGHVSFVKQPSEYRAEFLKKQMIAPTKRKPRSVGVHADVVAS